MTYTAPQNDPVNHPSHYTTGSIEVIDFIEDQKLPYHLGNTVKYICRAGKKDPKKTTEDLRKSTDTSSFYRREAENERAFRFLSLRQPSHPELSAKPAAL